MIEGKLKGADVNEASQRKLTPCMTNFKSQLILKMLNILN